MSTFSCPSRSVRLATGFRVDGTGSRKRELERFWDCAAGLADFPAAALPPLGSPSSSAAGGRDLLVAPVTAVGSLTESGRVARSGAGAWKAASRL